MRFIVLLLTSIVACACIQKETVAETKMLVDERFQSMLDSMKLKGSILIYDLKKDSYHSNDFKWAEQGYLPASTYKIPNSIIALETAAVAHDSVVFKWDGQDRWLPVWEQDLTFLQAFQYSCVPCYQEVARAIGVDQMRASLDQLDYGNIVFDETDIDQFWLQGESKISLFEQIDFLRRLQEGKLPIEERTRRILKSMLLIEQTEEYSLYGKTGWSIQGDLNNGWFVGYVEKGEDVFFFATNIEPQEGFDMSSFANIRRPLTLKALALLDVL